MGLHKSVGCMPCSKTVVEGAPSQDKSEATQVTETPGNGVPFAGESAGWESRSPEVLMASSPLTGRTCLTLMLSHQRKAKGQGDFQQHHSDTYNQPSRPSTAFFLLSHF